MATIVKRQPSGRRLQIITQWFEPEPAFKGLAFAREMAKRGFDVEVVTGFPNYPSGRLYPGYKMRLFRRELIDEVKVVRLPLYPSHDDSPIRRTLNYASFAFSLVMYGIFFMRRSDVMYVYHPPLTVGIAASIIRLIRRTPFVYDVQDLWPDTLSATGMLSNKRVLSLVGVLCQFVYRFASRISVLSPGFKAALVERGVAGEKVFVVLNWADEVSLSDSSVLVANRSGSTGCFDVVFAGNIGRAQGLDAVLDAASLLANDDPKIRFMFFGTGVERRRLEGLARQRGLRNVSFFDPVPQVEIGPILARAGALLVHLRPDPLFDITIPSKTQAYMCVGRPIIMAARGDAAALVVEAGAGVVAEPGNSESIAEAVRGIASMSLDELGEMSGNARRFYQEKLSFKRGIDATVELLCDALRR